MLKDELQVIRALFREAQRPGSEISGCFSHRLQNAVNETGEAWTRAFFSSVQEDSLKRYFHYHQEGIRQLSDTLSCLDKPENETYHSPLHELNAALVSLTRLMSEKFAPQFNRNAIAPRAFYNEIFAALTADNLHLQRVIGGGQIDAALKSCLCSYLGQMLASRAGSTYPFGALFYYQNFVARLKEMEIDRFSGNLDEALAARLVSLNFNQLDFMLYHANAIRQQAEEDSGKLKLIRDHHRWRLAETEPCYPDWPSISGMLAGWLGEELAAASCVPAAPEKLSLNLSVAHLACLTRLFFEENIYNSQVLTGIFKFIAGHFQTKRQARISTGSLSKEYYSISQVTAAVVRDKLLRMVARINHDYFPVLAVISGAALFCSAVH